MASISESGATWLVNRGIPLALAESLGLESVKRGPGEWLCLPSYNALALGDKYVAARKYRRLDEKQHSQDANPERILWNRLALIGATDVCITEGEWDAMIGMAHGPAMAYASVPDGANDKPLPIEHEGNKYDYLVDAYPLLAEVPGTIYLAFDDDHAGRCLSSDVAARLGKLMARVKWVRYPKGCKDLTDAWMLYGAKGVRACFERATPHECPEFAVRLFSQAPPAAKPLAYSTCMPDLDAHYKVVLGHLVVLTGIPGHGKTTWLNDLACRLAHNHGLKTCFFSFEQDPGEYQKPELIRWYLGGNPEDFCDEDVAEAVEWIDRHFSYCHPARGQKCDMAFVEMNIERAKREFGAHVVVLDPWNEIEHARPTHESVTEYINKTLAHLQSLAWAYKVHLIVAAHPKKMARTASGIEMPCLYDIADSAAWANKPEVGIIIHRDKASGKTLLMVEKSRYQRVVGYPGVVEWSFDPHTNRYRKYFSEA